MNYSVNLPDCKMFTGYKPCIPGKKCLEECSEKIKIGGKILIICLEAIGAVLQTTSILKSIKRKYPESTIYWLTLKNAHVLLINNQFIDKLFIWDFESLTILQQIKFDILFCVDKSQKACAFANSINAEEKYGFGLNENGSIIPYNEEALYLYTLGLDDDLKFRKNNKTGQEILSEAFVLPYKRDEYVLKLTDEEIEFCENYKKNNRISAENKVIGFNTGCSELFPNKKMTIEQHIFLINELSKIKNIKLALLGGKEDTERNQTLAASVGDKVINTPTTEGLRKGICYENICDIVITGDTLGMHIAIALKKYTIAWFGLSCWTEIDLYERGVKLIPDGLFCAPCWKKKCPYSLECIKNINLKKIINEVKKYLEEN